MDASAGALGVDGPVFAVARAVLAVILGPAVYDARPRVRRWVAWGAAITALCELAYGAVVRGPQLLSVALTLAWLVLNIVVLWGSRGRWMTVAVLGLAVASGLVAVHTAPPFNVITYTVMVMTVVTTVPLPQSAFVVAGACATIVLLSPSGMVTPATRELVPWLVVLPMTFIYLLGLVVRQTLVERLKVEELAQTVSLQNERLRISNEQLDRMAAREERTRIARDLHDRLGHALMTINVYLRVLKDKTAADESMATATARALGATERATKELRQCVGLLRESQGKPMLASSLERLIAALPEPPTVEFTVSGIPRRADSLNDAIVFRVLQEALTNVVKHAHAESVRVRLVYGADAVELEVADDGEGATDFEHGYGLRGLAERLAQVGGTLTISTRRGEGFGLTARLPLATVKRNPAQDEPDARVPQGAPRGLMSQ